MPLLTQQQLDAMVCGSPDCDHSSHTSELHIHSQCHTGGGIMVITWRDDDELLAFACYQCGAPVSTVKQDDLRLVDLPVCGLARVSEGDDAWAVVCMACESKSAKLDVAYDQGQLTFKCYQCETHLGVADVARE